MRDKDKVCRVASVYELNKDLCISGVHILDKNNIDLICQKNKDLIYGRIKEFLYEKFYEEINEVQLYSFISHISSIIRNIREVKGRVGEVRTSEDGNIVVSGAEFSCPVKRNDKLSINEFSICTALNKYVAPSRAKGLSILIKLFDVPVFYVPSRASYDTYVPGFSYCVYEHHILDIFLLARYVSNSSASNRIRKDILSTLSFSDTLMKKIEELGSSAIAFVIVEAIKESYREKRVMFDRIEKDLAIAFMLFEHTEYVQAECKEEVEIKKYLAKIM